MDDIAERRAARRRLAALEEERARRRAQEEQARGASKPRGLCTPPAELDPRTSTFSDYLVARSAAFLGAVFGPATRLCLKRPDAPAQLETAPDLTPEQAFAQRHELAQAQQPQRSKRTPLYPPLPHSRARTPPPQRRAYYKEEEVLPVARFPERAVVSSRPWARTGEAATSGTDLAARDGGF